MCSNFQFKKSTVKISEVQHYANDRTRTIHVGKVRLTSHDANILQTISFCYRYIVSFSIYTRNRENLLYTQCLYQVSVSYYVSVLLLSNCKTYGKLIHGVS